MVVWCGVIVLTLTAGWLSAGDWARLTIGGSLDRLAVPVPLSVRRRGPGIAPLDLRVLVGCHVLGLFALYLVPSA
jgi:hypothetical protein